MKKQQLPMVLTSEDIEDVAEDVDTGQTTTWADLQALARLG